MRCLLNIYQYICILIFFIHFFAYPESEKASSPSKSEKITEQKIQHQTKIKKRQGAIDLRYVLENRDTGDVISFNESSIDEVVDDLRSVNVSIERWHSCSQNSKQNKDDIDSIGDQLDVVLLVESLGQEPAAELSDSQMEWVRTLSPCRPEMRLHLKALSLILKNYKVIRHPG